MFWSISLFCWLDRRGRPRGFCPSLSALGLICISKRMGETAAEGFDIRPLLVPESEGIAVVVGGVLNSSPSPILLCR